MNGQASRWCTTRVGGSVMLQALGENVAAASPWSRAGELLGKGGFTVNLLTLIGFVVVVIWLVNELPGLLR